MKKKFILSLLLSVSVLMGAAGCNKDCGTTDVSSLFIGFDVVATDTAEIGQYYTPIVPTVTYNGQHVYVSLKAEQAGAEIYLNAENALLIESFDDVILTYTVQENNTKLEKQTVVKVDDTTKPYVIDKLPEVVYRGESFEYLSGIKIGDLSGTVNSTIKVTDGSGRIINTKDGALTIAENSKTNEVKFVVSAVDGKNNETTVTITRPVVNLPLYTKPIDFTALDVSKIISKNDGTKVEKAVEDNLPVAKISMNMPWSGRTEWLVAHVVLPNPITDFDNFDYFTVKLKSESNCDLSIYGVGKEIKAGDNEIKEIVYDMDLIREGKDTVVRDGNLRFNIAVLAGRAYNPTPSEINVNFYVYDIEFFYDQTKPRSVSNESPINLSEFGLSVQDISQATYTPYNGEAEQIEISTYCPKNKGTLTLSVKKKGYRTTTIVLPINPVMLPVENGNANDNDACYDWKN